MRLKNAHAWPCLDAELSQAVEELRADTVLLLSPDAQEPITEILPGQYNALAFTHQRSNQSAHGAHMRSTNHTCIYHLVVHMISTHHTYIYHLAVQVISTHHTYIYHLVVVHMISTHHTYIYGAPSSTHDKHSPHVHLSDEHSPHVHLSDEHSPHSRTSISASEVGLAGDYECICRD